MQFEDITFFGIKGTAVSRKRKIFESQCHSWHRYVSPCDLCMFVFQLGCEGTCMMTAVGGKLEESRHINLLGMNAEPEVFQHLVLF